MKHEESVKADIAAGYRVATNGNGYRVERLWRPPWWHWRVWFGKRSRWVPTAYPVQTMHGDCQRLIDGVVSQRMGELRGWRKSEPTEIPPPPPKAGTDTPDLQETVSAMLGRFKINEIVSVLKRDGRCLPRLDDIDAYMDIHGGLKSDFGAFLDLYTIDEMVKAFGEMCSDRGHQVFPALLMGSACGKTMNQLDPQIIFADDPGAERIHVLAWFKRIQRELDCEHQITIKVHHDMYSIGLFEPHGKLVMCVGRDVTTRVQVAIDRLRMDRKHGDAPSGSEKRDWPGDFEHENGNYQCTCLECGKLFLGHKRRVICRVCTKPEEKGGDE